MIQKQPPVVFYKKAVLKNFAIFTGKQLCRNLFLIKFQTLRGKKESKKRLYHKHFLVNIVKFLGAPVLKNICDRLVLHGQILKICEFYTEISQLIFIPT